MQVWGITGTMGSGKSTAATYLKSKNIPILDADQVSRIVVDRNTELGKEGFVNVYKAFGNGVLDNLGNLDRRALRKRMMLDPRDRDVLEGILHPLIVRYITEQMRKWKEQNVPIAFVEGTRLVESGFHKLLAGIILVSAPMDMRVKRLVKRDSMGVDEVKMMCALQDEPLMRINSKFEWKNDKAASHLHTQIDAFLQQRK